FLTVWALRGWSSRRVTVHAVAPPLSTPIERVRAGRARPAPTWQQSIDAALPPAAKGALGILAGILLLAWPSPGLRTVGVVVGAAFLVHGVVDVIGLRRPDGGPATGWRVAEIVAEIAVAALLLGWPGLSQVALLYALGIAAVFIGGIEAAS